MKFRLSKFLVPAALSVAILVASQCAFAASPPIKVGFIVSLSGAASSLGIPYNKGMQTATAYQSTVAGHEIKVITIDAQTNPSKAALAARKLINKYHVDIIIGCTTAPGTQAVAQIAAKLKTPMIALAPNRPSKETKHWEVDIVQPPPLMFGPLFKNMSEHGVKTVGYIGYNDNWGDIVLSVSQKFAKKYGIKIVANERFARSATSVAGQALKVLAQNPDAVITGASGAPGALPYLALAKAGYKGRLYGPYPDFTNAFVKVVGKAGNGLILTQGPVVVANQLPKDYPTRAIDMKYRALFQKVNGAPPGSAFAAYSFDAWVVFLNAAKQAAANAQPGTASFREALRHGLKNTHEVVGTMGIFNFHPGGSLYGLDKRGVVFVQLENGQWKFLGLATKKY